MAPISYTCEAKPPRRRGRRGTPAGETVNRESSEAPPDCANTALLVEQGQNPQLHQQHDHAQSAMHPPQQNQRQHCQEHQPLPDQRRKQLWIWQQAPTQTNSSLQTQPSQQQLHPFLQQEKQQPRRLLSDQHQNQPRQRKLSPHEPASQGSAPRFLSANDNSQCHSQGRNNENTIQMEMKDWIAAALHSLADSGGGEPSTLKNEKISSGAYLACALKIAHSLANQLCELEEQEGAVGGGGVSSGCLHLPERGLQWPDLVTVLVNKENYNDERLKNDVAKGGIKDDKKSDSEVGKFYPVRGESSSLNPDGKLFSGDCSNFDPSAESRLGSDDTFQAPVNPFGDSFRSICSISDSLMETQAHDERAVDYLNISGAHLPMDNRPNKRLSPEPQDRRIRIYYLGLVFFELFSGGNMPSALDDLGTDPLWDHLNVNCPTDLGNAQSIMDAIGDDDELFGGMRMDDSEHSSGLAEDSYYKGGGFDARKKHARYNAQAKEVVSAIGAPEVSSASVEPLKLLGLPVAMCDLIENMIECSGGDFIGDETYSRVADIKEDLKLMMERPDVYLRDLDLKEACATGLQMDDGIARWYGRVEEFASLRQSYRRSVSRRCEAAIIRGQAGVGKTKLALELVRHIKAEGTAKTVFLLGKFDKLKQSQPYSPIASAFDDYCEWLSSSDDDGSLSKEVSNALRKALGKEVYALARAIPSLYKIIGSDTSTPEIDSVEMLRYMLSQFAEVISRSHDAPLVIFLDNLQFADPASIALIKQILLGSGTCDRDGERRYFFLGCTNESGEDHPLWEMLSSIENWVNTTTIELDCFGKEVVNSMISEKLLLLPRLVRPLTEVIHHKTKGNPLFVRQLIIELSKEGMMRPSLSRRRWTWEIERIQERELPDDIVSFLMASLNHLPSEVRSAMFTLSCFGSSSDRSLFELEKELGVTISELLDRAVAESFLNKKGDKYHFVHDRLQEAAYNMMKPEDRYLNHYKYGLALCSVAERNRDDGLFLIAVGQINLGGPKSVADDEGRLRAARHNLSAGKKAMAASDFVSAHWFMDYGISYLTKGHWENHYELSLELFNKAAECAFISGEHDSLTILSEQIMRFARCIDDKLDIFHTTLRLLMFRSQLPAAIECGIEALSNIGHDFPEQVTPDVVTRLLEDTDGMLVSMSDEDLMNHKIMTNPKTIKAMKFWAKLSDCLYIIRPSEQPVAVLRMVQLSLMNGMCPVSPLAFVSYGHFLASNGKIREGARYAKVAKALLDKVSSRQVSGEVIAYSTSLMAYVEPVQSVIEAHLDGEQAAMSCGATAYAMMNAILYDSCCFWSGKKLGLVKRQLDQTVSLVKQYKHLVMWGQVSPLYTTVSKLIGRASSRPSNIDASVDSMFDVEKAACDLRGRNPFQSKSYHFNRMYASFMFRNYDEMRDEAEQYSKFNIGTWIVVFSSSIQIFYEGLVSFWIGREEKDDLCIAKGKNCLKAMERYCKESMWNFENKVKLLQAEEQFCEGNFELAEVLYDMSIYSAKEHRFVNEEALANDLAGMFHLKMGKEYEAKICFTHALEKYHEWGALAKEESLKRKLRDMEKGD